MSRNNLFLAAASAVVALVTAFFVASALDKRGGSEIVVQSISSDATIAIWIEGAVKTPGVYRLPADARLNDAVNAAGGLATDADIAQLNLADRVSDMQHIIVPAMASVSAATAPTLVATAAPSTATSGVVNINTADETELDSLPGIGPVIAARIVAYREANGPFARVEELARVDGISPAMVDDLAGKITVGP